MRKLLQVLVFVGIGIWGSSAAIAETVGSVNVRYDGWNDAGSVKLHYGRNSVRTEAGYAKFTKTGSTGLGASLPSQLKLFCMDVYHTLNRSATTYKMVELSDHPNGLSITSDRINKAGELFGRYYNDLFVGTESQKRTKAAAFSLCVWEMMTETGNKLDVAKDYFKSEYQSNKVTCLANDWLKSLDGTGAQWHVYSLVPQLGCGKQGQAFICAGVPEPATYVNLAGLALAAAVFCRRRIRIATARKSGE